MKTLVKTKANRAWRKLFITFPVIKRSWEPVSITVGAHKRTGKAYFSVGCRIVA